MTHQEKPYMDLTGWSPIDDAVNYAAIDDYEDAGVLRKRFFNWAIRGYRKLRLNLLRESKAYLLPVSCLGTVKIPDTIMRVGTVGYYDSCDNFISVNQTQLIEYVPKETKCTCEKCSTTHTLCNAVEYEVIEEPVDMNGTPYTNIITRSFDKKTGKYKEHRAEYIWNSALNQPAFQESDRELCTVEVLPCGCVKETEDNVRRLSCCCCNMTEYFAANDPYWQRQNIFCDEGFAIDYENRLIHVGMQGIKRVYMQGIADLPMINGVIYVPNVALETLSAYILYKRDQRRNIAAVQKDMSYQSYKRERAEMRKALIPIQADIIHNAFNLVPHG